MKNVSRKMQEILSVSDFPSEILTGVPVLEIKGDREAVIIRHRGVISYDEHEIRISSSLGIITVQGHDLVINRMNRERIQLCGTVFCVRVGEESGC